MPSSLRCRKCRQMFTPDPRVGVRQYTFSKPECHQERHRKDCRDWRQRTSAERQEAQLWGRFVWRPEKLGVPPQPPGPEAERPLEQSAAQTGPPSGQEGSPGQGMAPGSGELSWNAVRDAMGVEVIVLLREFQRILVSQIEMSDRRL